MGMFLSRASHPEEVKAQASSKAASFDIKIDAEKHANRPELLVSAAWSIVGSRWFHKDEIEFQVTMDTLHASSLPVRMLVGPEMKVEGLQRQLETQIGPGPAKQGDLRKQNGAEPRKFAIEYEPIVVNGGKKKSVLMLDCNIRESSLQLDVYFSDNFFQQKEAQRLARTIHRLLEQLTCDGAEHMALLDLDMISECDLVQIWTRNATVPQGVETPVHESIQRHAKERPNATAVCACDGSLTYKELDDLSTRLALGLIRKGDGSNAVVPLYFEKSKWMPVAILGVLKSGRAFLQLACSIPRGRTEAILNVDKPPFALAGASVPNWLADIVKTHTIHDLLQEVNELDYPSPKCSLSQDAVQLFTSGSTGQPKGISWTHKVLGTNCQDIVNVQSMGPHTRQFQTASYEFDVSMMETIAVLLAGGCLCIPREEDGINCSATALEALQANSVYLTPTLAEGVDPDAVPSLKSLALEGETLPKHVVSKWAGRVKMFNFYGPAECPASAACIIDPKSFRTGFAGSTSVALRWVVDPHNHNKLLPDGAIGELVIEGPIVLDRYIGNVVKALPFVSPTWLERGCPPGFPGRQGRLFKTGDLVRCDCNGDLLIIGRKDAQVQIHGERVELSEVEYNVRRFLKRDVGVAAEMITPAGCAKPILAAFLAIGDDATLFPGDTQRVLQDLTAGVGRMAEYVPRTFIPALFIAVESIPMTVAGKTYRRRLREMGASMTLEQLASEHLSHVRVQQ